MELETDCLDTTEELVGGPKVGPHDNSEPVKELMNECVEGLELVGCN